jgi:Icc-related predicted phosphoesterase
VTHIPLFGRNKNRAPTTRIVFATDVHGSDRCFRKFLNSAKFYNAQHLILGGDITGKVIVAIERRRGGYACSYNDHDYVGLTETELAELQQLIRDNGQYPMVGELDELQALEDEAHREQAFKRIVVDNMERWVEMAEDRLRGTGVRCFITPGNDDFAEIDAPLSGSDVVEFVEGRCIELDDTHEMITTGFSNITPWHSPRELDEPELQERIEAMAREVKDPERMIMVLHPPPKGTQLDQAPEIDEEFRVKMSGGEARMIPVGSSAVRAVIEEYQPLLGLHGHVHDSKAAEHIGRTLCVNPGSEYTNGTLMCALLIVADTDVKYQFVSG